MTDGKKNPDTSGSTAMSNVAYKRSWREVFLQAGSLSAKKHPEAVVEAEPPLPKSERMPLRGDFTLMSFERHGEIYPKRWGADPETDAPGSHPLDELPAGYTWPAVALKHCPPPLNQPRASI